MNKGDSEVMTHSLFKAGLTETASDIEADILVFNTCSVRQHAEERVLSRIGSIKNKLKDDCIIVMAGCMAQRAGQSLLEQKLIDIVIGPYESPKIGEIVTEYFSDNSKNLFNSQAIKDFQPRLVFDPLHNMDEFPWHKWVTITHGCENFCSYCIVPYVRGPLISFPSEKIIEYVKKLTLEGIYEITLLGQNVNQYGENKDIPFYKLLEKISGITGLSKINFITSHPKDFDENIIRVIRDNENISRAIHLPLQSGSNSILKAMNRKYTREHYLDIIEKIEKNLDVFSISTDIIVGFPGESTNDFSDTIDMVKKIRFDDAFMYAYSPREGTAAYNLIETISSDDKINRLNTVIELQRKISKEKLMLRINCQEEMIVERISKRSEKEVMGKTFLNHPVITPGIAADIGKKMTIVITELKGNTLYGKRIA